MIRITLLFILLHLYSCKSISDSTKTDQNFRKIIYQTAIQNNFSGSILISYNSKILIDTAFGFSDQNQKIKNTGETIFPIASITKLFIKHAIFLLVDQKLVEFDNNLYKYGIDIPEAKKITISDLVNHTSGLPDIHNELPEFNDPWQLTKEVSIEKLIEKIKSFKTLHFSPGEQSQYSNSNYLLLAYIIEKISNKPLDVFLHENIFKPYGMKSTGLYKEHSRIEGHAEGFYIRNRTVTYMPDFNFKNFWGSGNAYSTTHDLLTYFDSIQVKLPRKYNERLVQHSGYYLGFRSYYKSVPEIGFCAIILSNNGNSNPEIFITESQNYISDLLKEHYCIDPANSFSGEYIGNHLNREVRVTINYKQRDLIIDENKTIQINSNVFLLPENNFATLTFHTENNISTFEMNDNGNIVHFSKIN